MMRLKLILITLIVLVSQQLFAQSEANISQYYAVPTPVTSPPAEPREPPVAQDAIITAMVNGINMLLIFFIYILTQGGAEAPRLVYLISYIIAYIILTLLWRLRFFSPMSSLRL